MKDLKRRLKFGTGYKAPLIALLACSVLALQGCKTPPSQNQPPQPPAPPSSSGSPTPPSSSSQPSSPPSSPSSSSRPSSPSSSPPSPSSSSPPSSSPSMPGGMPSMPSSSSDGQESGERGSSSPSEGMPGEERNSGDSGSEYDSGAPGDSNGDAGDGSGEESSESSTAGLEPGSGNVQDTAQAGDGRSDEVDFSEEDPGGGGSVPTMSDGERQAQLEGILNETMASYDGMILREREYVLNRGNEEGSEEALEPLDPDGELPYDDVNAEGEENAPPGRGGSGQQESDSSGGGYRPGGPIQNRGGDYQHQGQTPPPADIPDGNDDDVVARQIREAAMREADPELREKLWDEYRKYKNQSN